MGRRCARYASAQNHRIRAKIGQRVVLMGRASLNHALDARMVRAAFEGSEADPVRGGYRHKLVCERQETSRVPAIRVVGDTL